MGRSLEASSLVGLTGDGVMFSLSNLTYQGKRHPWISVVLSALNQGALADTLKRFPAIAWVFMRVMPGTIQRIIKDTKKNEDYAIKLIKK